MIEEAHWPIDYDECGAGPTVVLVPGSCSTGAAWRPVVGALGDAFRCVTTSLLGYGGTAERRTASDVSITYEVEAVEAVVRRAGGRVHLVGHSFGGLVALAVALRGEVPLASLTIAEAPAAELLRAQGEEEHYRAFRRMTDAYFAAFEDGDREAIAAMVDFYGGKGTFVAWPSRARAYAIDTTHVNILDWASAYAFPLTAALLENLHIPVLVMRGGASHPAAMRANALISECIRGAHLATIESAAHFMITTHAAQVGDLIARHVHNAEKAATRAPA
jgi:pimeloyl-ACP methyl ester carboxylesterase